MKTVGKIVFCVGLVLAAVCSRKERNPYEDPAYNIAPEADFTIQPLTGDTATWFTGDASRCEDTEDDAADLEVRWGWLWGADSTWTRDWEGTVIDSFKYNTPGLKTVALAVRDLNGGLDTAFITINVLTDSGVNTAPTACFSVSASSGDTSTVFTFNAACCTDPEDSLGALRFSWDWNNDGTFDTTGMTDTVVTHRFTVPVTYTVKLTVTDPGSLTDVFTQQIEVVAINQPPVAAFTVTPDSGTVATDFSLDATGCTDPEDDLTDLQVYWDYGDGTTEPFSATLLQTHRYDSKGDKIITLIVKDLDNKRDTLKDTVTVINTAPVCSVTVNQAAGDTGYAFTFDASGCSDVDDPVSGLMVSWDWDDDGAWDEGPAVTKTVQHAWNSDGDKTVRVRVEDPDGGWDTASVTVTVKVPLAWVSISGGAFQMGSDNGQADEKPMHSVTVGGFEMTAYEVTNQQFADFLTAYGKDTDTTGKTMIITHQWGLVKNGSVWEPQAGYENHPVVNVTWYGANQFCTYYGYRLPTEAEWEYACRAGAATAYCYGDATDSLDAYAWYTDNSGDHTNPPGGKKANAYGLYDLHGNAMEWCADWYANDYYGSSPGADPTGPLTGTDKTVRGGSWDDSAPWLRSAARSSYGPANGSDLIGFRCVK